MGTIRGMVLTEESCKDESPPGVGETLIFNGTKHVVTKLTGHYEIERDEWQVVAKLAPIHEKEIHEREDVETPEWVKEAVRVED